MEYLEAYEWVFCGVLVSIVCIIGAYYMGVVQATDYFFNMLEEHQEETERGSEIKEGLNNPEVK